MTGLFERKFKNVCLHHLNNCQVNFGDVGATINLFGSNIGSSKGKTIRQFCLHAEPGLDPVPHRIFCLYFRTQLKTDIMFVNKVPFLTIFPKTKNMVLLRCYQNIRSQLLLPSYTEFYSYTSTLGSK